MPEFFIPHSSSTGRREEGIRGVRRARAVRGVQRDGSEEIVTKRVAGRERRQTHSNFMNREGRKCASTRKDHSERS